MTKVIHNNSSYSCWISFKYEDQWSNRIMNLTQPVSTTLFPEGNIPRWI